MGITQAAYYTFHPLLETDEREYSGQLFQSLDALKAANKMKLNDVSTKGREVLEIDNASVVERKCGKQKRKSNQKKIMKQSAAQAYQSFYQEHGAILHRATQKLIRDDVLTMNSVFRPEWLHLYGVGLTPSHVNPQKRGNLGASLSWVNTEMIVGELVTQSLAILSEWQSKAVVLEICPEFYLVSGTEIIKHVSFNTKVTYQSRVFQTYQSINPFGAPILRSKSDIAYTVIIAVKFLNQEPPTREICMRLIKSIERPLYCKPNNILYSHNGKLTPSVIVFTPIAQRKDIC